MKQAPSSLPSAAVVGVKAGAESPAVSIITDATEGGDLAASSIGILEQSLRDWTWTIVTRDDTRPSVPDDPRVRIVAGASRAHGLAEALAGTSPYVAFVDPCDVLGPTALEKWVWCLDAMPECDAVTPHNPSGATVPSLMRRAAVERAGTFDATRAAARTVATVPIPTRAGAHDGAYSLHEEHHPNALLPEGAPIENVWPRSSRRLLVVSTWMSLGGADKVLLDLLDQLGGLGWEATVATTVWSEHDWLPAYAKRTSDLFPLEHFLRLVDYPRFLAYLVSSRQPDAVLVTNSELGYRLLPYLRAHCPSTPFLDLCHSEAEHWNEGGYPRFSVEYRDFLDLTITVSKHLRRWAIDRGGNPKRIEVSYANVDTARIQPNASRRTAIRRSLGLPEDEPIILFAGRVSEDEQPRVIAGTLARLARDEVRFSAVVVGDGPDLRWLRRAVRRHDLQDRVRFTGALPHHTLIEFVQAADVFFLPSRSEGIALTLYEAMACAVPVVGAAVGGQAELVTNDCGLLVTRASVREESEAYAAALSEILADPQRRETMGRAARARVVASFDLRGTGPRMTALLDRAIELHSSEPRPALPPAATRAWATEAVELTRLTQLNNAMWVEHAPYSTRAYFALRKIGGPIYRHGKARGWPFLPATKRVVERLLAGGD